MACPLFDLTQADQAWTWIDKEHKAFNALKQTVTSAPVLVSPPDSDPFRIKADSSDFATGVVLSQQLPNNRGWYPDHKEHPFWVSIVLEHNIYNFRDLSSFIESALMEWTLLVSVV